jgi:UDP-N-acetylglucosamine 2-epimerase (non-hydrolysing)
MGSGSASLPALVTVVIGTRPELVKMAPVVREIQSSDALDLRFLHTGQHYDDELSETFIQALELPQPDVHLGVGSGTQAEQTAEALVAVEREVTDNDPDVVLAQGDTNAVLSAALATSKLPPSFGHVEAGIRSFDRTMPEEVNRVVADHVADFLFAPTGVAESNLADEGITEGVHVTGNTVVDACLAHRELAQEQSDVLSRLDLEPDGYAVTTVHRPRNTDDSDRLARIVSALDGMPFPVVFPAHPRTRNALADARFEPDGSLRLINPLGYFDFLTLLSNARVVVTDSGGVQEEASILEVPCLTVRPNTERPETVDAGVNELVEPASLAERLEAVYDREYQRMVGAPDLYGDGAAGERIVDILATAVTDTQ